MSVNETVLFTKTFQKGWFSAGSSLHLSAAGTRQGRKWGKQAVLVLEAGDFQVECEMTRPSVSPDNWTASALIKFEAQDDQRISILTAEGHALSVQWVGSSAVPTGGHDLSVSIMGRSYGADSILCVVADLRRFDREQE